MHSCQHVMLSLLIFLNFMKLVLSHSQYGEDPSKSKLTKNELEYMKASAKLLNDSMHQQEDKHESGIFVEPHDYSTFEDLFLFLYMYSIPFIMLFLKVCLKYAGLEISCHKNTPLIITPEINQTDI